MSVLEKNEAAAEEHADHLDEPFWRKYIFSQDHKVIGVQYGFTALFFMLFGFTLMLIMRWQLGNPGQPVPFIGGFLGQANAPGGIVLPDSAKEKPLMGTVISVGPGKMLDSGNRGKMSVKKKDVVLYSKYGGTDVEVDGKEYKIFRESEILGIVE